VVRFATYCKLYATLKGVLLEEEPTRIVNSPASAKKNIAPDQSLNLLAGGNVD
jgi:hypothetical protein